MHSTPQTPETLAGPELHWKIVSTYEPKITLTKSFARTKTTPLLFPLDPLWTPSGHPPELIWTPENDPTALPLDPLWTPSGPPPELIWTPENDPRCPFTRRTSPGRARTRT
eukprot:1175644-Prorocentrum_minimum.AAC.3